MKAGGVVHHSLPITGLTRAQIYNVTDATQDLLCNIIFDPMVGLRKEEERKSKEAEARVKEERRLRE